MENKEKNLIRKIEELKKKKNAVILVHNYQRPEIYEVADYIGDSLGLSKKAAETDKDIIVFCGVKFMAETAKILNPKKIVLLPAIDAGCPMAEMITVKQLKEFKKQHPGAAVVAYVNTNANIKAESDACCTSGNAVELVNSMKENEILFIPDKNLGAYVQTKTNKKIIPWQGYCHVHQNISPEKAKLAKEQNPKAKLIMHPECPAEVLKYADEICSTEKMVKFAKENKNKQIILATEIDMINRLIKENPENKYYSIGGTCPNMKKTTLKKVYEALEKNQYEINVPENIRIKASKALNKMISVG
ncbi:MAG: quinolinate synthase NadA [Candidatus Nanoarchaeia archaeon]|nr:quinolinate synthase NadA [Candidatus Nanoarchaeia archaeon]MDD5740468.1 quinolinate synthase NadA [Candidatus Nanoarchaeia archaeon]